MAAFNSGMLAAELVRNVVLDELLDDDSEILFDLIDHHVMTSRVALEMCRKEESNPDARVDEFTERVLSRYTPDQFKTHFRMYRDAFEKLCKWVGPHLPKQRCMTVEKKLLATLWLLATQEAYQSVADRFGMNRGHLHNVVKKVCEVMLSLRADVINWPQSSRELQELADQYEAAAGLPGVVGAVDETCIPLKGPADDKRPSNTCRKESRVVHLQVVCTKELLFLDVETGNIGSVHDSRDFQDSSLHARLESKNGRLPAQFHLLGDSAYPLREYLLVPFKNNAHLSPLKVKFNKAHAATHCAVERAIGLLKGKFRRLKGLGMTNIHDVPALIATACVLHNFIIRNSGEHNDDVDLCAEKDDDARHDSANRNGRSGAEKRLDIAHALP